MNPHPCKVCGRMGKFAENLCPQCRDNPEELKLYEHMRVIDVLCGLPQTKAVVKAAKTKRKTYHKTIACPICQHTLHLSIRANGHVWGKCEGEDCLSWGQ